jgi:hypothetical protein
MDYMTYDRAACHEVRVRERQVGANERNDNFGRDMVVVNVSSTCLFI